MNISTRNFRTPLALLVIMLGAVMGSLPAVIPAKLLPYFVGACILLGVGFLSFSKPALLLYFLILTSALSGLFRSFESLSFGTTGLTVSGFRWVFVACLILLVIVLNIHRARIPRHFLPFMIFVLWVTVRWVSTSPNTIGLKDILFYGLPPLTAVYTFLVLSGSKKPLVETIGKVLLYSVFIPLLLYIVLVPSGLIHLTQKGPVGLIDPRATAQYSLVILSLGLAQWRHAIGYKRQAMVMSLLALSIVVFTLSRIATATALLLFTIFRMNAVGLWKLLLSGLLAIILVASLLLGIPSFRARLFHQPPSNLKEALEHFNMMGRDKMWPATFNHALEKPIVGWGPGSARVLVAGVASQALRRRAKEWHPHNEYLQVFHDTGIIGLVLLLLAWFPTFFRYWRRWRFAHLSGDTLRAKWNMAAALSIILVLINSIVDNTLHYMNVLVPISLIIGCTDFLNSSWRGSESCPSCNVVAGLVRGNGAHSSGS